MSSFTIDKTVEFMFDDGVTDDDSFRAAVGVHSFLRVHSDHLFAKAKESLGIRSAPRDGEYIALNMVDIHFILLRALDLSDLKDVKVGVLVRPPMLSKALAMLKAGGGLSLLGISSPGAAYVEISRAAAASEPIKVKTDDFYSIDSVATSSWLTSMKIGMLLGPGATTGRVYAQFWATFGRWTKPADLGDVAFGDLLPLLRPLTGDLAAHTKALQARLVGQAFKQTVIPDIFDFLPDDSESELIRRASEDRFTPLFGAAWTKVYATLATAGNYDVGAGQQGASCIWKPHKNCDKAFSVT